MESLKVLTEKEAKKIIKESRRKELRRSIIHYLIDNGASSLSDIMYGITTCYVIKKKDNYFIDFNINRNDMKEVLHQLLSEGCVEFVGGHKWKATEASAE